ncbi:unnamed protein product [Schistosoma mattheei]|uniref:Uncharacterized protein n=1 Tax=Schistosoma mattheei TaxID=31246 RepID=A0A183NHR6_9TREM|nr:unnamed protein product [Schistosoma mattheei]
MRTRRGADIASDNHLVVTKIKLKFKKHWSIGQTSVKWFSTAFLRDIDKLKQLKLALNNRSQALKDLLKKEETATEKSWKWIEETLISTCQKVLDRKKHHYKEWISTKTLENIQGRKNKSTAINNSRTRTENIKAQAEYTEANKRVKSNRAYEQKYVEKLKTTTEKVHEEEISSNYATRRRNLQGNIVN